MTLNYVSFSSSENCCICNIPLKNSTDGIAHEDPQNPQEKLQHAVHRACLSQWADTHNTCPSCNGKFKRVVKLIDKGAYQRTYSYAEICQALAFAWAIAATSLMISSVVGNFFGFEVSINSAKEGLARGNIATTLFFIGREIGNYANSNGTLRQLSRISLGIEALLSSFDSCISRESRMMLGEFSSLGVAMAVGSIAGKVFDGTILNIGLGMSFAAFGFGAKLIKQNDLGLKLMFYGVPVSFAHNSTNIVLAGVMGLSYNLGALVGRHFLLITKARDLEAKGVIVSRKALMDI